MTETIERNATAPSAKSDRPVIGFRERAGDTYSGSAWEFQQDTRPLKISLLILVCLLVFFPLGYWSHPPVKPDPRWCNPGEGEITVLQREKGMMLTCHTRPIKGWGMV